jgi:hypothetical protein
LLAIADRDHVVAARLQNVFEEPPQAVVVFDQ